MKRIITTPVNLPDRKPKSIVIPAAGFGGRMKSYGPKSLLEIREGTRIIDNQLKHIYKYFHKPQIVVVAGYNWHKVREALNQKRNVKVVHNENWEHTNVAASIRIGLRHTLHRNTVILHGDLVFNAWTLRAPFGNHSFILTDSSGLMKQEEVGCTVVNNRVEQLMFDLPLKWAQISYFTGKERDLLDKVCNKKYDKYFNFELLNMIIESGGNFAAHTNKRMKITDIDSSKDLATVEKIL